MKQSYYLIKQILPHIEPNIIKIYEPTNLTHIKQLISTLIGEIYVYHYNKKDNSREDLTISLGNTEFDIYAHPFEKINIRKHIYTLKNTSTIYIKTYGIYNNLKDVTIPKKFYMGGLVYFLNSTEFISNIGGLFFSDRDNQTVKNMYGNKYEKYIGNKYINNNFNVTLNGIQKSYNDGGIDIIAEDDDTVILVQCKNWSLSNEYKINQKDLRAFVGDCYLYMRENVIVNKSVGCHFIVSHENILTKSAQIFLQKNTFIKFKCIPFEKEISLLSES